MRNYRTHPRSKRRPASETEYDYVVVGGGSAGSVVAGRLAERGAHVVVLEAGGTDRRPEVALPVGLPLANSYLNWHYAVEPDASRGGRAVQWPAGRVLGGSGAINAGAFVRGNKADYDGWAAESDEGWSYASLLPFFRRLESWEDGDTAFRGGSGPIGVCRHKVPHVANDAFIAASQDAGHPLNLDYNGATQDGVGVLQVNQRGRSRSHSSREYLHRLARGRVEVRTGSVADRVHFSGDRAVGVSYRKRRSRHFVRARQEVIISTGAIGTPKLLLLSGIGPIHELRKLGIEAVYDAPEVGANLQEHPCLMFRFEAQVPNLNTMDARTAWAGVGSYLRGGGGFLATTMGHAQVMHRSRPGLDVPDIQLLFANFAVVRELDQTGREKVTLPRGGGFLVTMMYTRPSTRGRVSLRSANPADPPRICHELLGTADMPALLAGIEELKRIMNQSALRNISGEMLGSASENGTADEWSAWIRREAHGGAHPVGTARLGADAGAVVDGDLRVRGVSGLRVIDASIMPRIVNGNTNAAAMMIGEKAADLIAPVVDRGIPVGGETGRVS